MSKLMRTLLREAVYRQAEKKLIERPSVLLAKFVDIVTSFAIIDTNGACATRPHGPPRMLRLTADDVSLCTAQHRLAWAKR